MNDTAQIITAFGTLIASLGTLLVAVVALVNSFKNTKVIEQVHAATNGMAARLENAARAEGNLQGRADEKAEHK